MDYDEEVVEYMKDDVLLLVESIDGNMVITHANLMVGDTYRMAIYLVGRLSDITGQGYNSTLDDLKEIEESK